MISSSRVPEFRAFLSQNRSVLLALGVFSALINLLALTGSIYMLQLYDRVLPSQSIPTLVALSVLMLALYVGLGLLDVVRSRMLGRFAIRAERGLRERVFSAALASSLTGPKKGDQPLRDLDTIRAFLSSQGPVALFDLPWLPLYILLVYLLHPWLGVLGAIGAALLVLITSLTEFHSRGPSRAAADLAAKRQVLADAARRNSETVRALGMDRSVARLWRGISDDYLDGQLRATDVTATYGAISKSLRMILQSAVLGLGAYLVIIGEATPGVMIAASILIARALAPIEVAIANWRGFIAARQARARLSDLFSKCPADPDRMDLPAPKDSLVVEGLIVAPPGQQKPTLVNVGFNLSSGSALGVIGPSAAGKSTLARTLVGAWTPLKGTVRLDGAAIEQWNAEALGAHIGYLPQDIELFVGTVAQNIARFDSHASSEKIISAAKLAGIHDMILKLLGGYDSKIGDGGMALSAGQRQRVALARALFGDPFLVVLDEPNAHLDAEGEAAVVEAIRSVRNRNGIVVVVAHRPSALAAVDKVLVLAHGQVQVFGPKDEILRKATVQCPTDEDSSVQRLRVVSETLP